MLVVSLALSDCELIAAIQSAVRGHDGLLQIHFPSNRLQRSVDTRPALTFSELARTVQYERLSVRLSPREFTLLRYVYDHQPVGCETLQDAVWGREVSDNNIRVTITRLNNRLVRADIPVELVVRSSRVSIEKIG